jgi:ribosome-associated protein
LLQITPHIAIDERELTFSACLGSGPGGQHVNRVESAVQLRFHVAASPSLPPRVKERLMRLAGRRLTRTGELVINAREYRSRQRNREAALERLRALVRQAAEPPKHRRPTRPTPAAGERRIRAKKQRARTKAMRRKPGPDD